MAAYLTEHPPVRDQWYAKRNKPLTGCTVLHTAESVMDTVGPDSGAENVAEFIRTRTTPGSYHDLVDSDSWLRVVELKHGAYHDGTGSNNWALSLSFACSTADWRRMSKDKRTAFLSNGARAFADQQAYRRSIGAPLTELRRITKAQSDRGESGFIAHGDRDPGRRTDPGIVSPNLFPFDEFFDHCRAALAGTTVQEEDDMPYTPEQIKRLVWEVVTQPDVLTAIGKAVVTHPLQSKADPRGAWGLVDRIPAMDVQANATAGALGGVKTELLSAVKGSQVSPEKVAAVLLPSLQGAVSGATGAVTQEQLNEAVRTALASLAA